MSLHREKVRATVNDLYHPVVVALSLDVLQDLAARGGRHLGLGEIDSRIEGTLRAMVAGRGIEDLEEAVITLELRPSTRVRRCAVAGSAVRSLELQVLTVAGRSRIRTRWVDMWQDWEHTEEWPRHGGASAV